VLVGGSLGRWPSWIKIGGFLTETRVVGVLSTAGRPDMCIPGLDLWSGGLVWAGRF
jgi:hypothetical protein